MTHPHQGVVVEVTNKIVVILERDGQFSNVSFKQIGYVPVIGETVTYQSKQLAYKPLAVITMAALMLLSVLSFGRFYEAEAAYIVVVDINPSVEVRLNEAEEVIDIVAKNKAGRSLLAGLPDQDRPAMIEDVLKQVFVVAEQQGYFVNARTVAASVIAKDTKNQQKTDALVERMKQSVLNERIDLEATIETTATYQAAETEAISINYYKHFKSLNALGEVEKIDEIKGKSLNEIRAMFSKKAETEKGNSQRVSERDKNSNANNEQVIRPKSKQNPATEMPNNQSVTKGEKNHSGKESQSNAEKPSSAKGINKGANQPGTQQPEKQQDTEMTKPERQATGKENERSPAIDQAQKEEQKPKNDKRKNNDKEQPKADVSLPNSDLPEETQGNQAKPNQESQAAKARGKGNGH